MCVWRPEDNLGCHVSGDLGREQRSGSLTALVLTKQAGLTGQRSLETCLLQPPQYPDYKCTP